MKKFIAGLLAGLCLMLLTGASQISGTGTFQIEVIDKSRLVVIDTRTSEIRIMRPENGMAFSKNERVIDQPRK